MRLPDCQRGFIFNYQDLGSRHASPSTFYAAVAHHTTFLVLQVVAVVDVQPSIVLEFYQPSDDPAGQRQHSVFLYGIHKSMPECILRCRSSFQHAFKHLELNTVDAVLT